jgi:hypothetical protein
MKCSSRYLRKNFFCSYNKKFIAVSEFGEEFKKAHG